MYKKIIFISIALFVYYVLKNKKKINFNKMLILGNPTNVGKVTSKYGERIHPITKQKKFHNGIDIAMPENTKIYNVLAGKVYKVYENKTGGKQLIIKHINGYYTGYAHLNKNDFFKEGENVSVNDIIALSGNTGMSTGAHLHLTVTNTKGQKIDPLEIFNYK